MNCAIQRREGRFPVRMKVVSNDLPHLEAEMLDLSKSGARLRLPKSLAPVTPNTRISIGACLVHQARTIFETPARVAWVSETLDGVEAGLEWSNDCERTTQRIEVALIVAAA